MKNTLKLIFWLLLLSIFNYTSAATLDVTNPTSGEVVSSQKYTFKRNWYSKLWGRKLRS